MKRSTARLIGIDLFSGAGGMSLGFEQAGFDIVAAVEIDPIHASTHQFNFSNCRMIPKSVDGLSGRDIRHLAGLDDRHVDVVFGGAPCQGFSMIGHRAMDDPRNSLVREFVRLVAELKPSYFVFENVKGLTIGRQVQFLQEVVDAFQAIDYSILLPWQVLDAAFYAVPQHRERLFLIGSRKGYRLPSYPEPLTRPADTTRGLFDLPAGPTCEDALGDLPEAEDYDELWIDDAIETDAWGKPSSYAALMRCLDEKSWYLGYRRKWNPRLLSSSNRTRHTAISQRRFVGTNPGDTEPISRFYKLAADGLSNTLRAGTDSARGAFTSPRPIHYSKPRCITVREMARLHGFPDWFRFHKTKWHGARQVGNAVPPPLAKAIATQIVKTLEKELSPPRSIVPLGDQVLLQMDMSEAARYWGVAVPIGRRDRKNGLRKRKQEEIETINAKYRRDGKWADQLKRKRIIGTKS
jgi:DNA (cytosine-5)-methyltransferase 1